MDKPFDAEASTERWRIRDADAFIAWAIDEHEATGSTYYLLEAAARALAESRPLPRHVSQWLVSGLRTYLEHETGTGPVIERGLGLIGQGANEHAMHRRRRERMALFSEAFTLHESFQRRTSDGRLVRYFGIGAALELARHRRQPQFGPATPDEFREWRRTVGESLREKRGGRAGNRWPDTIAGNKAALAFLEQYTPSQPKQVSWETRDRLDEAIAWYREAADRPETSI